jgi:hypothetical protein
MCATSFLISTSTRTKSLLRYADGLHFSFGDMPLDQFKEVVAQCGHVALRREQLKLLVHGRVEVGDGSCAALFASHRSEEERPAGAEGTSPAGKDRRDNQEEENAAEGGNHADSLPSRARYSFLTLG